MTTQELEHELQSLKQTLARLQAQVDRMTVLVGANQDAGMPSAAPIRWLDLIGAGKEIWADIDADAYINAERNAWN